MKNVLVTGGAGFIGSNFVRHLLAEEREVRVVNLDALTYAGSLENLSSLPDPARHVFVHGDIGDGDLVLRLISEYVIDTIVHFAAETHVDRSIAAPCAFIERTGCRSSMAITCGASCTRHRCRCRADRGANPVRSTRGVTHGDEFKSHL